ncbi:hypothetical protein [Polaribacter cellanae]|uniref:Uncharacterized protein n=1 Tax=Polaribacter cellanae TaxID=2818493 RepID=A0A975CMP8_9FLAO|nr:hypothetical protein [Polaribacter cellanae]QTE21365.1 hypothetical protein J3359_11055 [Polaribacter cellanae]
MKNLFKNVSYLFIVATITLFTQNTNAQSSAEKKLTLTYQGLNVSDNFRFVDSKGKEIVFHDEDEASPSKLSLFDESLIGKKFVVHYKWVDVMLFDQETGLAKDKTIKVKRITNFYDANEIRMKKNSNVLASNNK